MKEKVFPQMRKFDQKIISTVGIDNTFPARYVNRDVVTIDPEYRNEPFGSRRENCYAFGCLVLFMTVVGAIIVAILLLIWLFIVQG